jgi:hypothetical protein
MRGRALVVVVVLVGTTAASAQPAAMQPAPSTGDAPSPPPRPLCIVGDASCTTVLLLETTWGIKPAVIGPAGTSVGGDLGLEAGLLVNVPALRAGFGGSFGMRWAHDAEAAPFVARGRYRRWLSNRMNVDLSAGALIANVKRGGNGGTAQLSVERSGKIALVLNIDVYTSNRMESGTAFEVGVAVKFCGFWALPTALLTLVPFAALRGT